MESTHLNPLAALCSHQSSKTGCWPWVSVICTAGLRRFPEVSGAQTLPPKGYTQKSGFCLSQSHTLMTQCISLSPWIAGLERENSVRSLWHSTGSLGQPSLFTPLTTPPFPFIKKENPNWKDSPSLYIWISFLSLPVCLQSPWFTVTSNWTSSRLIVETISHLLLVLMSQVDNCFWLEPPGAQSVVCIRNFWLNLY